MYREGQSKSKSELRDQNLVENFYCIMRSDGGASSGFHMPDKPAAKPKSPVTITYPPIYYRAVTVEKKPNWFIDNINTFTHWIASIFEKEPEHGWCVTFTAPPIIDDIESKDVKCK